MPRARRATARFWDIANPRRAMAAPQATCWCSKRSTPSTAQSCRRASSRTRGLPRAQRTTNLAPIIASMPCAWNGLAASGEARAPDLPRLGLAERLQQLELELHGAALAVKFLHQRRDEAVAVDPLVGPRPRQRQGPAEAVRVGRAEPVPRILAQLKLARWTAVLP